MYIDIIRQAVVTVISRFYISNWLAKTQINIFDAVDRFTVNFSSFSVQFVLAKDLIIYIQKILPAVVNSLQRDNRILIDCINKNIIDSYNQIIFYRKIFADSILSSRDIILIIDNLENLKYLICLYIFWIKILGLNTVIKYCRYSIAVYRIDIIYIDTGDSAKYQNILTKQIAAANISCLAAISTEIIYID